MAKVQFGGGISAMSGKLGGNVFARNKGGAYTRNWVKPTNPSTPAQQNQRNTLALKSAAWRGITDSERNSWKSWAEDNPVLDRLGSSIVLSGAQAFTKININRDNASDSSTQAEVPAAPTFTAAIFDTASSLTISISGNQLEIPLGTGAADTQIMFVFASKPVSAGVTNTNSSMRLVTVHTIDSTDVSNGYIDIETDYVTIFGTLVGKSGLRINTSGKEYSEGQLNTAQDVTGTISS